MTWEKYAITNLKNQKLASLLYPADQAADHDRAGNRRALVIVCHGFTGSKEGGGRALAMGEELAEHGFSTLLFDFAGCGESEGCWQELSLTGQIDDLRAVTDWSRTKGYESIVLTGRSFGGSTVIAYGALDQKIRAVCTWAAVARPDLLFKSFTADRAEGNPEDLITLAGEEGELLIKRAFLQDLKRYSLPRCAKALAPIPLLIIHGSEDRSVPCEEAEILYNAAEEPKELSVIEGADHRFSEHTEAVWSLFFSWLYKLKRN